MERLRTRLRVLKSTKPRGFTIVELIVVIIIVGILAAIAAIAYNFFIDRANQATAEDEAYQIGRFLQAESAAQQEPLFSGTCSQLFSIPPPGPGQPSQIQLAGGPIKNLPEGTRVWAGNNACQPADAQANLGAPVLSITVDSSNGRRVQLPFDTGSIGGGFIDDGTGAQSFDCTDGDCPVALPAPTNLTAEVAYGDDTIDVTTCWDAVPGATSYTATLFNVLVGSDVSGSGTTYFQEDARECALIEGAQAGARYYVFVTATNDAGQGGTAAIEVPRNTVTTESGTVIETVATNPSVPQNLSEYGQTPTSVTLEWGAPASAGGSSIVGYKLQVSPDSSNWADASSVIGTRGTVNGLVTNSDYYFRVKALNRAGLESEWTDAFGPVVPSPTAISLEGNVTVASAGSSYSCPTTHPEDNGDGTCRGYADYQVLEMEPQVELYTVTETVNLGGRQTWPMSFGCPGAIGAPGDDGNCWSAASTAGQTVEISVVKERPGTPPAGWVDEGDKWTYQLPTPAGFEDDGGRYYQDAAKSCPAGFPNLVDGECFNYVNYDRLNYTYYSYAYPCGAVSCNCMPTDWSGTLCPYGGTKHGGCCLLCTQSTCTGTAKNGPPAGWYDNTSVSKYQRLSPTSGASGSWTTDDANLRYETNSANGLGGAATYVVAADPGFWSQKDLLGIQSMSVNGVDVGSDGVSENLGSCSAVVGAVVELQTSVGPISATVTDCSGTIS